MFPGDISPAPHMKLKYSAGVVIRVAHLMLVNSKAVRVQLNSHERNAAQNSNGAGSILRWNASPCLVS